MNLSKSVKELVIDRFKTGSSIQEIAAWYGQKPGKIEGVIREAMVDDVEKLVEQAVLLSELLARKVEEEQQRREHIDRLAVIK